MTKEQLRTMIEEYLGTLNDDDSLCDERYTTERGHARRVLLESGNSTPDDFLTWFSARPAPCTCREPV